MKQHFNIVSILLFFLVLSCKKKQEAKESYWTVNGETFTTVAMLTPTGKPIASLYSDGMKNRFYVFFYNYSLPTGGKWKIGDSVLLHQQNPDYAYINFYYYGKFYIFLSNQNAFLFTSELNKKANIELPPTWFVNYNNPLDSVLISGNFSEP